MTAVFDESGRIEIPEAVWKALGWKPGTKVEVETVPNGVQIHAVGSNSSVAREGSLLVYTGELPKDFDVLKAIEEDREERMKHVLRMELASGPRPPRLPRSGRPGNQEAVRPA